MMELTTKIRLILRDLFTTYWNVTLIILTPILLLPIPLIFSELTGRCAYVVFIMAIYWMTEALPLAVTAFIPIIAYPLLGVASIKEVCPHYLRDSNFLFMGGLIMAVAVEESGLHERLALRVLLSVGSQPKWLLFGFMFTTGFLSMWMSNTATTAMMLPIALAVTDELLRHYKAIREAESNNRLITKKSVPKSFLAPQYDSNVVELNSLSNEMYRPENGDITHAEDDTTTVAVVDSNRQQAEQKNSKAVKEEAMVTVGSGDFAAATKQEQRIAKMLLISLCYAANIGGTGTLTGTVPNLVLMGILETYYPRKNVGVTFASWLEFNLVPMLLSLLLSWLALQVVYLGFGSLFSWKKAEKCEEEGVSNLLRQKYNALGKMRFAEKAVLFWFIVLALLWIFRQPEVFPGWSYFFKAGFTHDAISAMFISIVLFIFPREKPDFLCFRKDPFAVPVKREALMTWNAMQKKFPWSVIMLLGGGFAMADGVQKSGLSDILARQLAALNYLPDLVLLFVIMLTVVFITEFTSNVATASIFVPLGITLADGFCVNPLYFALPITLASSYAFMLPVATPPNAIVFSAGRLKVWDMVLCGCVLNVVCIFLTLLNVNTWTFWLFDLGKFPDWGLDRTNGTCAGHTHEMFQ